MQTNQISIKAKPLDAADFIKAMLCILGIVFCFVLMFFTLEKYTYNEFGKFMDNLPLLGKYLITMTLNAVVFLLSYKLFFAKRKAFIIVYIVPFIVSIVSTIMYWQGFLRITDPTDSQSILLYKTALTTDVLKFFIVLIIESLAIVLTFAALNKKSIKK